MIDPLELQTYLTNHYQTFYNLSYDEAADKARDMLKTERIEIATTTDTNDFEEEFNITLYYILPDHLFIYRVEPLSNNTNLYQDHYVKPKTNNFLSDINSFTNYINQNITRNDDLKNQHEFDLDTFGDHMLDNNNKAPFYNWREIVQVLRVSDPDEVEKAIIAYQTYTESEEWLLDTKDYMAMENEPLLNPKIDQFILKKLD